MSGELFQATMLELAAVYDGDRKVYISTARQYIQNLVNLFKADATRTAAGKGRRGCHQKRQSNRVEPETCRARFAA